MLSGIRGTLKFEGIRGIVSAAKRGGGNFKSLDAGARARVYKVTRTSNKCKEGVIIHAYGSWILMLRVR